MRACGVKAAIFAAALVGGGAAAHAMTAAPASGWFFTPLSNEFAANAGEPLSPVALPFGQVSPAPPIAAADAAPFALQSVSPLGAFSVSGYSAAATAPHLLSGGLIARDGPVYTVRDLEIVDRVADNLALEFGYGLDLGRRFDPADVRSDPAYGGLFLSSSDRLSPFATLDEQSYFAGATAGLGQGLSLSVGESLVRPDVTSYESPLLPFLEQTPAIRAVFGQRQTALAGANWNFAPWGGVGLVATHTGARSDFLGGSPALALSKASASSIGATAKVGLGSGWVTTFTYNENVTQLDLRPAGTALTPETVRGRSFGLAVAKHGLFGGDMLGIAVSRPLDLGRGGIDLGAVTADPFDGFISQSTHPILGSTAQETDLELGYVTTFMDGALALQANAGYQTNVGGQSGNNGVTVLSRAKINF